MSRRVFFVTVWSVFCLVFTSAVAVKRGDLLGILGVWLEIWLVMIGCELV